MICSSAVFDFGALQHNEVYVVNSNNQPHPLHPLLVFVSAGYDINAGGVDAGMAEDICEFRDILFYSVEYPSKQVAKIMQKNLFRRYSRFLT